MSMPRCRPLIVLCVLLLTACGGGSEPPPEASTPPTPSPTPAARPAPAAPETSVVREAETSEYGFYTIQISSWQDREKAEAEARRWQQRGLETYVLRSELPGRGVWFRVRAGRYPGYSVALEAMRSLIGIEDPRIWVDDYIEP